MKFHLRDDQFERLVAFNDQASRLSDLGALMALGEKAFESEFGHRLFTLLKIDRAAGVYRRIYSTDVHINPVGGTKPILNDEWSSQVLDAGRHFIGRNRADLKRFFSDHETLLGMGCESVLNTPVIWRNVVIGSINQLDVADHYTPEMCALASLYAQCLAPAFLHD